MASSEHGVKGRKSKCRLQPLKSYVTISDKHDGMLVGEPSSFIEAAVSNTALVRKK